MKIPASIRRLHEDQKAVNDRLKEQVDNRMASLKQPRWHYESRVKELLSFALKIESGRFDKPFALEDFFACTFVVANAQEVTEAEKLIRESFTVKFRKPKQAHQTHKASDSFPFDDLRLYVTLQPNPILPPTDLLDVLFEVQIKTFLQHAWSIATHDLLYKTDDVNWSKQRIAYQIKAMLEHAEISIQEAENLATSASLDKEDRRTTDIKKGIKLVKAQWTADELPPDVRRLAENVTNLLEGLQLKIDRLEQVLNDGKTQREGIHPANLSPYATIVQYLFEAEQEKMMFLLTAEKSRTRILIPLEVELPPGVKPADMKNAVFVVGNAA